MLEPLEIVGTILGVLGAFISIMLTVNAYFFKSLVESTNDIKLKLGVLITQHTNTEKTAVKNAEEIDRIRVRLHKLEGATLQTLNFIESYGEDYNP